MKIEIKEIDASWRELTVTVEAEEAIKDYHIVVNQYKNRVRVPGFRPGKAPLRMVEQLFGKQFKEEFILKKAEDYYKLALDNNDLHPINEAEILSTDWEMGKDFVAVYKFQTIPAIVIQHYEGLEVPFIEAEFSEEMVVKTLKTMQEKLATQEEAEIAETGNLIVADFVKVEPEKDIPTPLSFSREFILNDNIYTEEMNEKLSGLKAGDSVRSLIFNKGEEGEDEEEEYRTSEFDITIRSIKRTVLPELNDEFARDAGFGSLEELRDNIIEDNKTQVAEQNEKNKQTAVEEALLDANPIEVPDSIIHKYANQLAEDAAKKYKVDKELLTNHFLPLAEHNIKLYYLMHKLTEILDIQVSEEDKEETIKKAAANLHIDVEEYKTLYAKQISDEDFEISIKDKKAMDYLIEKAVFVETKSEDSVEDSK